MNDLERRALLGDKQAQEECTRRGILLPCPFCGYGAELVEKDSLYSVVCKDGCCIASDIQPEYGAAMVALADWNTRPAPPIGRCGECAYGIPYKEEHIICKGRWTDKTYNDFCSDFVPKGGEEDGTAAD